VVLLYFSLVPVDACVMNLAVGWEFNAAERHVMRLLRVMILKAASSVEGMTALVEQAKKLFGNLATDFGSVHPELRDLVMNVAVANGGEEGTMSHCAARLACFAVLFPFSLLSMLWLCFCTQSLLPFKRFTATTTTRRPAANVWWR
jgi:hypothetical protein